VNPLEERRRQDLAKITRLGARSRGRIAISEITGAPLDEAVLTLAYKTAPSPRYPEDARDSTRIRVVLSARYPFQEPAIDVLDPVFNPNVYGSGRFCLGAKWMPTEGLDMLILRVAKILTFDPEIMNDRSPANMEATQWYKATQAAHPHAFPTDVVDLAPEVAPRKVLKWTAAPAEAAVPPATCPTCAAELRHYGASVMRCPVCEAAFEAGP
jgi:hypothetical protein